MGLYSNAKRMATMFCAVIALSTVLMLALRLTVFSDMASVAPSADTGVASVMQSGEIAGGSGFTYKIASNMYYPRADAKGEVLILNPEINKYLLNVNIILPETKTSLYYTGTISPGTSIEKARLSDAGQKLENGVYQCVAEILAVDPETMTPVAKERKNVTVYIGVKP